MNRKRGKRGSTYIFLGLSGSGKDTQATYFERALGRRARRVSTGDGLRRAARRNSLVGHYIRGILKRGDLVPYWAPAYIWLDGFFRDLSGDEHLIFTGAPRRIEEAEMLDRVSTDLGRDLPRAILVEIPKAVAIKRLLQRGRADDNRTAMLGRFRFFKRYVQPVIRYYRTRARLITVDGNQPQQAVWREIKRKLKLR